MSTSAFANGEQLLSTALTPPQIEIIFQVVVAQILGFTPSIPAAATLALGSPILTAVSTGGPRRSLGITAGIFAGQAVTGLGIPENTSVVGTTRTTVTLSSNATAGGPSTLNFATGTVDQSAAAYSAVRIGWQQEGQPAWTINDNVCSVMALPENSPFSQWRDSQLAPNDSVSVTDNMSFTQVWAIRLTLYGPNCFDNARLIVSAMWLAWVHHLFASQNLYVIPAWNRPRWVAENFANQWWPRADVVLRFNEAVLESTVIPTVASVPITVKTATLTDDFVVEA